MKAGSETCLTLGIAGAFLSLMRLAELLSGRGDIFDILGAVFFAFFRLNGLFPTLD